jgi:lipopolysaccharide heptosyltransferase II
MPLPEKVLIIRFSSIGDVILASPLVRVLRAGLPGAQIDFVVKAEYADLLLYNPHLSSVIQLRTRGKEELSLLRKAIRRTRYDLLLDIHNSLRSRFLRLFSGASSVRVVRKRALSRFILVNLKRNLYRTVVPVPERYLETVKGVGITDDGQGLEVFVPPEVRSSVAAMLDRYKLERYERVIGLAPTAKHFTKRWPGERFVEFGVRSAQLLRAKLLIFGGREDQEYCGDLAQMINAESATTAAESLAGRLSILESAVTMEACHVIVSNDTGMMHLAAAARRKVVAVFGSTVREFGFFPYRTEHSVVETKDLPCRPCSHVGLDRCPEGHFRCMRDIRAAEVLSAVQSLLAEPPRQDGGR